MRHSAAPGKVQPLQTRHCDWPFRLVVDGHESLGLAARDDPGALVMQERDGRPLVDGDGVAQTPERDRRHQAGEGAADLETAESLLFFPLHVYKKRKGIIDRMWNGVEMTYGYHFEFLTRVHFVGVDISRYTGY